MNSAISKSLKYPRFTPDGEIIGIRKFVIDASNVFVKNDN